MEGIYVIILRQACSGWRVTRGNPVSFSLDRTGPARMRRYRHRYRITARVFTRRTDDVGDDLASDLLAGLPTAVGRPLRPSNSLLGCHVSESF